MRNFASFLETTFLVWANSCNSNETRNFRLLFMILLVRGCLIKMFAMVVRTHVQFRDCFKTINQM